MIDSIAAATPGHSPVTARRRMSSRGAWLSLLFKELRESRGLLIAGLWICWLMPAALELPYYFVLDRRFLPIVGVTIVGLGWIFAIIAGAQVVCRDWGRAEEHFLRAQPVSTRGIVSAKWWAGSIVVAVVGLVPATWTLIFAMLDPRKPPSLLDTSEYAFVLTVGIVFVTGYAVAFAAAFLSRQMLTAVLAGLLVVVGWWVSPWLSHRFNFLHPTFMRNNHGGMNGHGFFDSLGGAFIVTALFTVLFSWVIAHWAAQRESAARVTPKFIAWTVAAMVLLVFSVAMNEVGNSLSVHDQRLLPQQFEFASSEEVALYGTPRSQFASRGDVGFILRLHSHNLLPAVRVQLGQNGNIEEILIADLQDAMGLKETLIAFPECSVTGPDELAITAVMGPHPMGLLRARFHWVARGKPSLVSLQKRTLPADAPSGLQFMASAASENYGYLLLLAQDEENDEHQGKRYLLYVYDWSAGSDAPPAYTISRHVAWMTMVHQYDRLSFYTKEERSKPGSRAIFDPNDPEAIVVAAQADRMSSPTDLWRNLSQYARSGYATKNIRDESGNHYDVSATAYDPARHLVYFNSQELFGVCDENEKVLGLYRFNLLAGMLRSWSTRMTVMPGQKVLEVGETVLSLFDVSDPKSPRKIGFFNMGMQLQRNVFALGDHLLLLEGRRLSVLGLPSAKRN